MSSSENDNDQRRRQREAPDANINNKKRSSSSSIISINLPNETSNADNEQIRQQQQQKQQHQQKGGAAEASTTSIDDSLSVAPTSSTTRKGSAFPMRHPANVKLHSNDFQFSDYAKKLVEQSKNGVEEDDGKKANDEEQKQEQKQNEQSNSSSVVVAVDAATSSNCTDSKEVTASEAAAAAAATIKPKKEVIELQGDAAQSHLQKQGQAWEMHYRHSQNHFFPVKNYLAQAFRSVVLPLFPPIENPEGCNEFDDATKNNGEETDENTEQQQQEEETKTTVIAMKNDDDDDKNDESEDSKNTGNTTKHQIEPKFIIECGCGTGSSLLPLMSAADFHHYAGFDISETAVELFKNHDITKNMIERKKLMIEKKRKEEEQSKDNNNNNNINPLSIALPELFVLDAAEQDIPHDKIPKNSADVCLLIFVLSAIDRTKMLGCLKRLAEVMKPGTGQLCFRDYGILDNSYFRFQKNGNKVCRGSFVKGDDTQQYFFSLEEVQELFDEAGFDVKELTYHCNKLTNRKTGVEMHKIIVNGIFTKRAK